MPAATLRGASALLDVSIEDVHMQRCGVFPDVGANVVLDVLEARQRQRPSAGIAKEEPMSITRCAGGADEEVEQAAASTSQRPPSAGQSIYPLAERGDPGGRRIDRRRRFESSARTSVTCRPVRRDDGRLQGGLASDEGSTCGALR